MPVNLSVSAPNLKTYTIECFIHYEGRRGRICIVETSSRGGRDTQDIPPIPQIVVTLQIEGPPGSWDTQTSENQEANAVQS